VSDGAAQAAEEAAAFGEWYRAETARQRASSDVAAARQRLEETCLHAAKLVAVEAVALAVPASPGGVMQAGHSAMAALGVRAPHLLLPQ